MMDKYIGKRLDGRYEIQGIIGVGGMAYVYKAHDNIDNRTVAVKILKEEFMANDEFTRRFKNESKAIAILSHPNIVKVYDVSFGERIQYIVMEYIDGITLKEYIDQQKEFKWKEAVHFTVQILRALQHAHDKGIVHRDIKPQNIMLLPDGTIKVTDFGIARFSRQDIRTTRATDKAIGSVHYISPEQARGEITDEKADIYSVGVMLYEMLAGQLPFEADSAVSVAIMQLQAEAKPPREINPSIPEGLQDITVKAMQKDPSKRYQSAAEMLNDIDEFKKNPSIHFEYKYFVDESPTRYMETISRVKGTDGEKPTPARKEEEEKKGFPIVPVLGAVAAAVVLVTMLVVGVSLAPTILESIPLGGLFGDGGSQTEVVVPKFVGKHIDEISNNAEYMTNFIFDTQNMKHSEEPYGTVLAQSLEPGLRVKKGTKTIVLTISQGPKMVQIPNVVGMSRADAEATLRNNEFKLGTPVFEASEGTPADHVISVQPAEYPNELMHGSEIILVISTGAQATDPIPVPSVVNISKAQAMQLLKDSGFNVTDADITYVNNADYPADTVIEQSVTDMAVPGTTIKLTVCTGFLDVPMQIQLPDSAVAADVKIYVKGDIYQTVTDVIPNQKRVIELTLSKPDATYTVLVQIAKTGSGDFKDYAEYTASGKNGTATEKYRHEDILKQYEVTTTVPTTAPTTATTPPANTESQG